MNKSTIQTFILVLSIIIPASIFSATVTSTGSGNWTTAGTWDSGVPKGNDIVIIKSGHSVTLDTDVSNPGISLTVEDGGSLISSGGDYGIYIKTGGSIEVSGTVSVYSIDVKNNVDPKYIYSTGDVTVSHLFDHSGTQTVPLTVDGSLTINPGTLDNDGVINGTGTVFATTYSGSGTVFGVSPTNGQTIGGFTWDGETSTDWGTSTNWSQNNSPTLSTHDVVIPGGLSNYPTLSGTGNICRDMIIESGALVTVAVNAEIDVQGTLTNNAGITGLVIESSSSGDGSMIFSTVSTPSGTIKRHVSSGEWNMISPSTTGITAQTLYDVSANDSWLSTFDEATGTDGGANGVGWSYITDLGTSLTVGAGYNYWPSVDETISFTGSIQNTNLDATLTYTGSDYGYNLIGNPFSSALQWNTASQWNLSNLELTIWIWNGSQYNSYTTSATHDIPVGQGVFVRATGASPTLTFPVSQRVHGSDAYQKSNNANSLYENSLLVYTHGNGYSDRVQISFGENGTRGFENGWDATKMFGLEEAPQLFVSEGDLTLSYDHLPVIDHGETTTVVLNLISGNEGEHSINVDLENYTGGEIIIEDRLSGSNQTLTDDPIYTFDASKLDDPDRFLLHFTHSPNKVNNDTHEGIIDIYSYGENIYVRTNENKPVTITVFDLAGRTLHQQYTDNKLEIIKTNVSNSYLVIQVACESSIKTEKVFVK